MSPWSNPKLGDMGNKLQRLGFCTSCTELEEEFGVKICTVEQSWDSLEFHVGQQEIQVLGEQGTEIMDNVKTQDPHLKALIRPRCSAYALTVSQNKLYVLGKGKPN